MLNIKRIIFGALAAVCVSAGGLQAQIVFELDQYQSGGAPLTGTAVVTLTDQGDDVLVTYDLTGVSSPVGFEYSLVNSYLSQALSVPFEVYSASGGTIYTQGESFYNFLEDTEITHELPTLALGASYDFVLSSGLGNLDPEDFLFTDSQGNFVELVYQTSDFTVFTVYGTTSYTVVPEPSTYLMLGSTLALVAVAKRRKLASA